jgi:hypothetical protein
MNNLFHSGYIAVGCMVVGMQTIGPSHPTDMLGSESLPQRLGLPEVVRYLRWSNEFVPRGALTDGTLRLDIVCRQSRATATIAVPRQP